MAAQEERTRPPTLEEVAAAAGVSRALASLVMRGAPNVSTERRNRVLAAAADLDYRPNAIARSLASPRTRTIGVLLNDLHNPFFADVLDGVEDVARREGYDVLLGTGQRQRGREVEALSRLRSYRVDAIVIVGSLLGSPDIARAAADTAIVTVSRSFRSTVADSVICDEGLGTQLAVEHLLSLGHQLVAHLDGGREPAALGRRRGYERAMRAAGLAPMLFGGDFSTAGGASAARSLLAARPRPTAVVAANDLAAVGAMDVLDSAGLTIPGEISLVGYDNTFLSGIGRLRLTSVDQPRRHMGQLAGAAALDRLAGRQRPQHDVVPPALVVRDTTGAPPTARG